MKTFGTIISLFSGALGLDLGLEKAGFRTSVVLEANKTAIATIKANRPRLPAIAEKIENVPTATILEKAGLKIGEATLVTGGPSCQSFSTAGKRASLGETRGELFREFKRVINEARPRFFVMENVKGILSAAVKHRVLNERGAGHPPLTSDELLGSALKVICAELAELDYHVRFGLVNAADFGVPQKRYRVIFIGSRDGEDIQLPEATHSLDSSDARLPWVTLREALKGIKSSKSSYSQFSPNQALFLGLLSAGENWRHLPESLQKLALGGAYDSWGGRCGFCRRLSWDVPSPTLTTSPSGKATTLCHPTKLRPLSATEYAAIQQFPSTWKFSGTLGDKYIQIGNAVPVGLGTAIGRSIRKTILQTALYGLPKDAKSRLGKVIAEKELEEKIKSRRKTQLHPPRLRSITDLEANREWLNLAAA